MAVRFGRWVRATQARFDFALAFVSFLAVSAVIFLTFSMASFAFVNETAGWDLFLIGFGLLIFAFGTFFLFMDGPLPKHRMTR